MSSTISALPAATGFFSADIMTLVQSGVNKKMTRDVMLFAQAGQTVTMGGAGSVVDVSGAGNILINAPLSNTITISNGVATGLALDGAGNATLQAGQTVLLLQVITGGEIRMDPSGHIVLFDPSGTSVNATYVAMTPTDWATSPPNDFATALDRISHAVAGLLGSPIP